MHEHLRPRLLRFLRVPHDPDPPAGAPGSLRIFRGGANLYKLSLLRWSIGQVGALVGIGMSLTFLAWVENSVETFRTEIRQTAPAGAPKAKTGPTATSEIAAERRAAEADATGKAKAKARKDRRAGMKRVVERWPPWIFPVLTVLEFGAVALYLLQIPITLTLVRLDYELRWYMVTDRSLRIRSGVATIQESTMSFANIQQVVVSQGPLQRLLGLADVRVRSAGGGGDEHESAGSDGMHLSVFHGVDNAHEIRDLILARLRTYRTAGLGDPDDAPSQPAAVETSLAVVNSAAKELLLEARALRQALA